jgi:hypothetical protein
MKIIGRILIILAVFSAVAGLMVFVVNASGSSAAPFGFDGAPSQFRSRGDGNLTRPEDGFNPGNGQIRTERGGREGRGGSGGLMFGMVRNFVILAVLVTLIALPRNIIKKKKRRTAASPAAE